MTALSNVLLAIDVGNTHTVIAVLDQGEIKHNWRVPSHSEQTPDDIRVMLTSLFTLDDLDKSLLCHAVLCSVVPSLQEAWRNALTNLLGEEPLIFKYTPDLGIVNKYKVPSEVGSDRLANVLIAHQRYHRDLVVVDLGTATTFDVLDKEGNYLGGIIAPGMEVSAAALAEKAARLTTIDLAYPEKLIGDTTADSFRSGILFGTIAMIEGIIDRIDLETGKKHFVIATGGLSELIARECRRIDIVDPFITIFGLYEFYKISKRT